MTEKKAPEGSMSEKKFPPTCICGVPVETRRTFAYDYCYDCWWIRDPRHPLAKQIEHLLKEELEPCAVSFDWIAEVVSDGELRQYARNCASLIRTGDLPHEDAAQARSAGEGEKT